MIRDDFQETIPAGGSTMIAAYVVIAILFCCSILIFLVFMLKMKGQEGETPRNRIKND